MPKNHNEIKQSFLNIWNKIAIPLTSVYKCLFIGYFFLFKYFFYYHQRLKQIFMIFFLQITSQLSRRKRRNFFNEINNNAKKIIENCTLLLYIYIYKWEKQFELKILFVHDLELFYLKQADLKIVWSMIYLLDSYQQVYIMKTCFSYFFRKAIDDLLSSSNKVMSYLFILCFPIFPKGI